MNLIIVESPTKARTLSRFLGKGYSVEATMGHIKDLPKSKLSIDIEHNFKPDYQIKEERNKEIKKLRTSAKKAKSVYLATDPDREGEAIAQHVREILRDTKNEIREEGVLRITFHEITKSAVEHAIGSPRKIDDNLVNAQTARRVLDRLVGYKLSPLLWKKVRRGLSAGRVQTVAVRLVVEREREIEAFKPEEYWEIYVDVSKAGKVPKVSKVKKQSKASDTFDTSKSFDTFTVKLLKINDKKAELKDGDTAKKVVTDLEKAGYRVYDVQKKEVRKGPYPPFTTSTLTQTASRFWGWSAKRTMITAQKLYEEGLITYHRTDSTSLAGSAVERVRKYIQKEYGESYVPEKARFYKTKSKSAQEAHEAIRPTKVGMTNDKFQISNGKDGTKKLYDLIWKRFVACQMTDSVYDETRIDVEAIGKRQKVLEKKTSAQSLAPNAYLLRTSGQVMKFDGWRRVIPISKTNGEVELPEVVKDQPLKLLKVDPQQKFTQPPARYTEASLIKTLEKLGIGRPSTYAPTISTIQIRNYVEKDEGKFKPTEIGKTVNDFLLKHFQGVFDYDFTADMEDSLDKVAEGERKWTDMVEKFYNPFEKTLKKVEEKAKRVKIETEKLGKKCPKCKEGEQVIRVGRFGKFISCSRFPDCDFKAKYEDRVGMKCPECKKGNVVIKKTRRGRKFFGCSRYPDCKWASWTDPKKNKHKEKDN